MLAASLLLAGLLQVAPPVSAPPSSADLKAMAQSTLGRLETMRGQKLSRPLVMGVKSRAEVTRFIQERLREEYGPAQVEAEGELLTLMGLLPAGTRYGDLVTRLLTEQVAGFYDHTRQTLHLADWIAPELQAPVMAHEIFHAIQDQEWGGGKLLDSKAHSHDAVLAHAALLEGDATQVMIAYMQSAEAQQPQTEVDAYAMTLMAASLPASMASAEFPVMSSAPDALKQSLVFPYQSGLVFFAALRNLGWKSADFRKLYSDPPESTEQILHPEKYATQRDRPVRVEVDLPKGVQRPWTNTAGELHYRQVLSQRLTAATAERAAAGWGGDLTSLEHYRVGPKTVPVVTAVTVWDTEADAREFDEALRASHAARGPDAPALASQLDGKQVRLTLSPDKALGAQALAQLPTRTRILPPR